LFSQLQVIKTTFEQITIAIAH